MVVTPSAPSRLGIVGSLMPSADQPAYPRWPDTSTDADLLELRADYLTGSQIMEWVVAAPRPLIVTIRRRADGGGFTGGEEERRSLLTAALQGGARYIDVEWGSSLADLANGPLASQVILSQHTGASADGSWGDLRDAMLASSAAYVKLVTEVTAPGELRDVHRILCEDNGDGRLIHFSMGRAGALSRLLTLRWGGAATYGSLHDDGATASGQWRVSRLRHIFAVHEIEPGTSLQFLLGRNVYGSPSPAMHRAAASNSNLDVRYLPLELDEFEDLDALLESDAISGLSGLAVTLPFKEAAAERCHELDPIAEQSRSSNTVCIENGRWYGANTDGPAAAELLATKVSLRGARVQIIGAGGTAAAIAVSLARAGCQLRISNRTADRGQRLAARVGGEAVSEAAEEWPEWDVLVQTTPRTTLRELGLTEEALGGRVVLDAVYGAEPTELILGAARCGLAVIDGLDLLLEQGREQFRLFNGLPADPSLMRAAATQWLLSGGA